MDYPRQYNSTSSVVINDQYVLSTNHPDLNDNPYSIVSYSFTPVNNEAVPLVRGGEALGDFAQIAIQLIGHNNVSSAFNSTFNGASSGGNNTFALVETGPNTGIFQSKIGMKDLEDAFGHSIKVGDKIRIIYLDNMVSPKYASSAVMSVV